MLPAFISAEDPSRKQKSNDVKPRGMRKKPSSGKENIPVKENSLKPTRIPGPQKIVGLNGKKVENKEQPKAGKVVQSQKIGERNQKSATVQTRSRAKPVPDFGKIHQQWDKTLSKGKAMKKKPLTQIDPFNLTNANSGKHTTTSTSGKGRDNDDFFQPDPASYQSILDGKLSMVPETKVERNTVAVPKRNIILKDAPRGSVQDFKVDFKPDSSSLKEILQERDVSNTPARDNSTFGPIKRMTYSGVSRTKPYNKVSADQERRNTIFYNEKLEKFDQLTFEQKLTAIINSRPGLSHARRQTGTATGVSTGNRNSFYSSRKPDATNKQPAPAPDNAMSALADSTGKFVNQTTEPKTEHSARKSESSLNKIAGETPSTNRPKPKLPRQLCQVNIISPRKETPRNGFTNKFEIKSPSAGIKRLKNATPIRYPSSGTKPQKTGSVLAKGATRLTAEARYNIQHGLPLPPKERRYEFVDLSKPKAMTPKRLDIAENDTGKGDLDSAAPAAQFQHLQSSGKTKKSVRWADVLERRKSSARELNFDQESEETKSQLAETQPAFQPTNLQAAQQQQQQQQQHRQLLEDTLISRVLRNIEATRGHAETTTVHANSMPKPFINPSVIQNKVALNMDTDDWNAPTPKDASRIGQIPSYIEPKSVVDRAMDRLRIDYVKFTPPAAKAYRNVPQCPSSRRRWARTPHAQEEANRMSANSNLDCTATDQSELSVNEAAPSQSQSVAEGDRLLVEKNTENATDDTRLRSLTSQEQAPIHRVKTVQNLAETKAIDNFDSNQNDWKSGVDLSRGILPVLDQINRLSIRDDIKRVFVHRTLSFASPRAADRLTATSTKSGSDSSLYFVSKGTEKTKAQPDYSSDSGVYRIESVVPPISNLTSKSHALKAESRPSHQSVHSDSSVTSSEFPHHLAIGSDNGLASHSQTLTGLRGQTNGGVIYSTAPMRMSPSSSASNHRQVQQSFSSKQIPNEAQMTKRPAESPFEYEILTKTSDSPASQGMSRSNDTLGKISAIVDQYMRPVRSMIDSAFTAQLSNQAVNEREPLIESNKNNLIRSQSTSFGSLSNNQPVSDARKRLDSGTTSSLENSNTPGSAFRRVPAVSSLKTEPVRSYADRALRIECPSTPEYCKPALLDAEVAFHTKFLEVASRLGTRRIEQRECRDPVARILSDGDDYRFIPIAD